MLQKKLIFSSYTFNKGSNFRKTSSILHSYQESKEKNNTVQTYSRISAVEYLIFSSWSDLSALHPRLLGNWFSVIRSHWWMEDTKQKYHFVVLHIRKMCTEIDGYISIFKARRHFFESFFHPSSCLKQGPVLNSEHNSETLYTI